MKYEEKKLQKINLINNKSNIKDLFSMLENNFKSHCLVIKNSKIIYTTDKYKNLNNDILTENLPNTVTKRKYIKLNDLNEIDGNIYINNFLISNDKYFTVFKYNMRYMDYEILLAFFNKIKLLISNES